MKKETRFIRNITKICKDESFKARHIFDPEKDFTRNRKMNFSDVIFYTLGNNRSSASLEAIRFREISGCETLSEAAIRANRQKVNYTAFRELLVKTARIASDGKDYHGYQLVAVDGMKGVLPNVPSLTEKYARKTDHAANFHAVAAYDVLNEVFLDSDFSFGGIDEHEHGVLLLDTMVKNSPKSGKLRIFIYDRGFPSLLLLQRLIKYGEKFVMRVSSHFLREVNEFRESKAVDKVVTVTLDSRRLQTSRVKSDGEMTFDIRCVRIKLPSGEEEILVTNLEREEFPKRYIKEIYGLRWGIETGFNYLKNAVFVEEFTSRKENGIQQDYYASLLVHNFTICVCGSAWADMPLKKRTNQATEAQI